MRPIWRAFIGVLTGGVLLAATPAVAMAQRGEPEITSAPTLAGLAQVGQRLDATGASWTSPWPVTVEYIWLRCDSESPWSCDIAEAPRQPSYTVMGGDLGKRIRVVVAVSSRDGTDYAWSEPTAAVTAAPPPPPAPLPAPAPVPVPAPSVPAAPAPATSVPPRMMRPAPVIGIKGWLTNGGAMISRLTVRAPRGVRITVRCRGRGCPRESLARSAKRTRLKSFEGRLRAGTRLVVRVTRKGFIGKHTTIRIRRGKAPARRDRCLYPGSGKPKRCPAG